MKTTKRRTWLLVVAAAALIAAMCAPSGMRMMGDAMVDAGGMMRDAAGDGAAAQDMGGGATVASVPASENPAQVVGGSVSVSGGTPVDVGVGPMFFTDFAVENYSVDAVVGATGCGGSYVATAAAGPPDAMHGARIFVPAGHHLCFSSSSNVQVSWAGFRPY